MPWSQAGPSGSVAPAWLPRDADWAVGDLPAPATAFRDACMQHRPSMFSEGRVGIADWRQTTERPAGGTALAGFHAKRDRSGLQEVEAARSQHKRTRS